MNSIDLKSGQIMEDSNQVNLDSFSQLNNLKNKETSFIESKNGPSVLLKHNVSKKDLNCIQKSKSASYLPGELKKSNEECTNLCSNYSKSNLIINNSLINDLSQKKSSNQLLTSTPNLMTNINNNFNKLIETPKLEQKSIDQFNCNGSSSSTNTDFPYAIHVKNVSYDFHEKRIHSKNVLRNINLICSIGSIYGLLGPSGCGKTTLIKLILGKYKPIQGQIKAFGYDVNDKYSGLIGSGVGYMPQELALIFDFTIEEQLTYFGRLYFMSFDEIKKEINHLCNILDLHDKTRLIHQLSGGQQHRVSFASALIHKPRLLILDEPTVGLDPILRERIWSLLASMSKNSNTTILITTHYIEEAKRANMISFLRKGQLLIEQTPQFLMKTYETNSLERIFFKICIEQLESKKSKDKLKNQMIDQVIDVNFNNSINEMIEKSQFKLDEETPTTSTSSSPDLNELNSKIFNKHDYNVDSTNSDISSNENLFKIPWVDRNNRSNLSKWFMQFFAITLKHLILTKRRPETVLAQYVLPIVAVSVFCVCIGSTPTGIRLGIVNEEDCGFPYDMNQKFNEPIPENSISEFIKRFEIFFKGNHRPELYNENRIKFSKRSIEEHTTLNFDLFNEDEVTTVYPSKFNLLNNLNFNENKDKLSNDHEPESENDLLPSGDISSIDKLIANRANELIMTSTETSSTISNSSLNNHKFVISINETNPKASNEHSPILMANKEENTLSETTENTESPVNESTDDKFDDEVTDDSIIEEDEEEAKKMRAVNTQFEDACFSQDLIRLLNSFVFVKVPYTSYKKAIEDVKNGDLWGVLRIKKGFSRALISKILFQDYGDANLSNAIIEVNADMTNRALVITLEVAMSRLYPDFIKTVFTKANQINLKSNEINHTNFKFYNVNSGRLPIVLGTHVFKAKFVYADYFGIREFAVPGLLIIISYSISFALTVLSLITEISDKMFDRHQCIGLTSNQLILSHLLTRFIFSTSGTLVVLFLSIYFFDITNHGSLMNAVTLLLLQSYCAMAHGMLISSLCSSIFVCASISNGYLFFLFIISGVLWSFETLPDYLKQFSILLPSTIPCEALRTIMTRGQGFESQTVVLGYVVTIVWTFIHYFLTMIVFSYRKNRK